MADNSNAADEPSVGASQIDVVEACACRLRMACLDQLASGPVSVTLIAQRVGWTQPEVSRALVLLRKCGCVDYAQRKRERLYRLTSRVTVSHDRDRLVIDIASGDGGMIRLIRPPRAGLAPTQGESLISAGGA